MVFKKNKIIINADRRTCFAFIFLKTGGLEARRLIIQNKKAERERWRTKKI
jgi:hypothetical protein